MYPQKNWTLQDLRCAVATETGIPAEEQWLISGSTVLVGASTRALMDILPNDARDLVCVRKPPWIVIPVEIYAYRDPITQFYCTIEQAKSVCEMFHGEKFCAFTHPGHGET